MSNELSKMFDDNTQMFDAQKEIIAQLLNDENLETKTELDKPLRFSVLTIFQDIMNSNKLIISSTILKQFLNNSYKLLISHNRQGRKEYIEALQMLNQFNSQHKESNPLNPMQIK